MVDSGHGCTVDNASVNINSVSIWLVWYIFNIALVAAQVTMVTRLQLAGKLSDGNINWAGNPRRYIQLFIHTKACYLFWVFSARYVFSDKDILNWHRKENLVNCFISFLLMCLHTMASYKETRIYKNKTDNRGLDGLGCHPASLELTGLKQSRQLCIWSPAKITRIKIKIL